MMPRIDQHPIMDYVRAMQRKVRELEAQRERVERPVWWWGFGWGVVTGGVITGYVLAMYFNHGG